MDTVAELAVGAAGAPSRSHRGLIDYAAFDKYLDFGGMRVEDDVPVTADGCRVLGPHIPRTAPQIEEAMHS